jgi:predicted dehydrogenase
MPELQVIAICDTNRARAVSNAEKYSIPRYYTDFTAMLETEKPSLVSILTPPQSHADLCVQAAAHGVDMVIEKPFAPDTESALQILEALKRSNAKMTVVYHWLFCRAIESALDLLKAGTLGEFMGMDITLLHTPDDPMAADKHHWCHTIPGGRFGEMLPHPVYLLQAFIGEQIRIDSVISTKRGNLSWLPADELHVLADGERGTGNVYVSFNAPRKVELVTIYCTKKNLRIDLSTQTTITQGPRGISKLGLAKDNLQEATQLVFSTARNAFRFRTSPRGEYAIRKAYSSILAVGKSGELVSPAKAYETVRLTEEICNRIDNKATLQ